MAKLASKLGASKSSANLLVIFVPSVDRDSHAIDQNTWVDKLLDFLGRAFGGATAFPKARGVWRDDQRGSRLVFDEPVVVQCYTTLRQIEERADSLRRFLVAMGIGTNQGAVGLVIDREYLEIRFPSEGKK